MPGVEYPKKREQWQATGDYNRDVITLLSRILTELEEQAEEGQVIQTTFVATTTMTPFVLPALCFTVQINNDGAVAITVRVPFRGKAQNTLVINPGEDFEFSFKKGVIPELGLQASAGTASVRVTGTY